MKEDFIDVIGAREHNLRDIDVRIPKNKLVVITGISGSGKSSLAFDTIYAEGQRRYMETFGAYARQFIGKMDRPDVEDIKGSEPRHFDRAENNWMEPSIYSRAPLLSSMTFYDCYMHAPP